MKKGECGTVGCYDAISWDAGCLTGLQYHHRVFHKLQVIIIIARVSSFQQLHLLLNLGNMNSMSFADHPDSDILMPETRIQIQKCWKFHCGEVCKTDIFQSLHWELGRSKLGAKQHCYNYFGTNRNLFSIYFNMHEIHSEIYLSHLMVLPFTNTWNKKCFIIFRCTSIFSTYQGE